MDAIILFHPSKPPFPQSIPPIAQWAYFTNDTAILSQPGSMQFEWYFQTRPNSNCFSIYCRRSKTTSLDCIDCCLFKYFTCTFFNQDFSHLSIFHYFESQDNFTFPVIALRFVGIDQIFSGIVERAWFRTIECAGIGVVCGWRSMYRRVSRSRMHNRVIQEVEVRL